MHQSQILILKILNVFLRLKFLLSLTSKEIEHFEIGSKDILKGTLKLKIVSSGNFF